MWYRFSGLPALTDASATRPRIFNPETTKVRRYGGLLTGEALKIAQRARAGRHSEEWLWVG